MNMKSLTLVTLMLAGALAQAKTFNVQCSVPSAQTVAVTFTGNGSITIDDSTGETSSGMHLQISGPGLQMPAFDDFFYGDTKTITAGTFMPNESYGFVGTAEHMTAGVDNTPLVLKMFLGGPKGHASSRVIMDGAEYHSNCDIVPEAVKNELY